MTPPLPSELQIEVTGACNLKCQMCLVRYRPALDRRTGSLDFDTFQRLIDDLPDLREITLQGLGEPLLAPDLYRMIEYASARGIVTGFNTNGTLLTRERGERLIAAGLAWLRVSLDGATAATYEGIRDGARFERVRRNVAGLVEIRQRLQTDRPRLRLVFVAMRRNVDELPALVRLAADWGVEYVWVQNLSHSFADTDPAGSYGEIRAFTAAEALWNGGADETARTEARFEEARALASALAVELRLPRVEGPQARRAPGAPGCDWPWRSAYVTHDAKVQPCCMVMGSDRATLGELGAARFSTVWRSTAYARFRDALLGEDPPPVCRGCSMYRGVF